MLPPAQLLPFAATTTDLTLYTGNAVLLGWSFAETTNSATASLTLNDGPDDTYPEIVRINLAINESTRDYPPGNGILIRTGIFLEILSGSVEGTIWFLPITNAYDLSFAIGDLGIYRMHPGE